MYVCVCNALSESRVRCAIRDQGAQTPDQIFRACGAEPCCRQCVPDMRRMLREAQEQALVELSLMANSVA